MRQDILSITNMLKSGNPVTIFPEGRCTNGDDVMDFHGGYIEAAIDAGIPVVPVCMTYKKFNGEVLGAANRDFLFIYGKTPFGPHIVRLIRQLKSLELTVRIFPPIESGGKDRKQIATEAFQNVSGYYRENSPLSAGLLRV
jgi:1-acyl-sn-glycerol-3-phosphate acyltransferase